MAAYGLKEHLAMSSICAMLGPYSSFDVASRTFICTSE